MTLFMDLLLTGESIKTCRNIDCLSVTVAQAASINPQRIGHTGVGACRCASASRGAPPTLWRVG